MKLVIEINLDNADFDNCNGAEAARILVKHANAIRDVNMYPGEHWSLYDTNGNKVGKAKVTAGKVAKFPPV